MNFNNYTIKAQEAIQLAIQLAENNQQLAIEPGHLLQAILQAGAHNIEFLCKQLNVDQALLANKLGDIVRSYPKAWNFE